jgi:hypothetical protein
VRWRKPDREVLDAVLSGGIQPGRVVLRGLALRPLPDGQAVSAVAAPVQLTPKAVREIGRRYEEFGLDRAL